MKGIKSSERRFRNLCIGWLALFVIFSEIFAHSQKGDLREVAYRDRLYAKIAELLEKKYVIAEKAKGYADEFRSMYQSHRYDSIIDAREFAVRISSDLQSITGDKHNLLRVIEPSVMGEQQENSLHHSIRFFHLRHKENTGFYKLEWIRERIGYLDIRRFYSLAEAREMISASMRFLQNADAIIVDVRRNGGGSGDTLSSCFLEYPTQLNSCYYRVQDYTEEFWTRKEFGIGPFTEVPLFILIGKDTFSAAESFAYDMKVRKRAVLIGEPTRGGAHSVDLFKLDDRFEIYISTARAINPVTGGNWEGTGVIPDIQAPPESALDTAIERAERAAMEFADKKMSGMKPQLEEMQDRMVRAENLYRENRISEGDTALDSVFSIAKKLGMLNEFFVFVLAYNFNSEKGEPVLFPILRKSLELFPDSMSVYETAASFSFNRGRKELAIKYFKKILELDPENRNARRRIAGLENGNRD